MQIQIEFILLTLNKILPSVSLQDKQLFYLSSKQVLHAEWQSKHILSLPLS